MTPLEQVQFKMPRAIEHNQHITQWEVARILWVSNDKHIHQYFLAGDVSCAMTNPNKVNQLLAYQLAHRKREGLKIDMEWHTDYLTRQGVM
jgi:hypothetical protein